MRQHNHVLVKVDSTNDKKKVVLSLPDPPAYVSYVAATVLNSNVLLL